ncbi:hypothetical protein [Streptomyces sp. AP-93]|uniref:hypothetical protein n=1 Tax=Streptomyces sp. AP-93 TaxID=2929048 RepID=UPI001FAFFCE6|nr:hypothetical protein [Streptomyces sp. AP-93]MCJ0874327.1 hypothetical protein [Streptomyces sp. AP-93]
MDNDLLDAPLDGVTDPCLKLISRDEARAVMALLGLLDDDQPEETLQPPGSCASASGPG